MNIRTAIAFILAPSVVPLGLYLYVRASASPHEMSRVGITYSAMLVVCYALAVVAGIPMYRFMRTYNHYALRHYLLGGALIGGVPGLAFFFIVAQPDISADIALPVIFASLVGAFSAAVFWLIGICGSNK